MSFLHGLPPADSACGGVEVDSNLHELPPVGGVRDQIPFAVYLAEGFLDRTVHLQLENVDMSCRLQHDVSTSDRALDLALDVQAHHGEQEVEDSVVVLLGLVVQVVRSSCRDPRGEGPP